MDYDSYLNAIPLKHIIMLLIQGHIKHERVPTLKQISVSSPIYFHIFAKNSPRQRHSQSLIGWVEGVARLQDWLQKCCTANGKMLREHSVWVAPCTRLDILVKTNGWWLTAKRKITITVLGVVASLRGGTEPVDRQIISLRWLDVRVNSQSPDDLVFRLACMLPIRVGWGREPLDGWLEFPLRSED